jgi:hypothetical protein
MALLDIQDLPQVVQYGSTDTHEGEKSNHLATQGTCQRSTCSKEPEPPCPCELSVSLLMKFDVTENRQGHEED